MDNSFFVYLQQLELIAFFSGYPLIYTGIIFVAGNLRLKNNFISRAVSLLPFAYALTSTLFLGFELKKISPDFSLENIKHTIQLPYLTIWGLLSIFFWIPALSKKKVLSLMHGLVFFMIIVKDLFFHLTDPSLDSNIVRNDMKVYLSSIILNLGAFITISLISFLYTCYKRPVLR
ncbi:MAG TPA: hypothetical protein VGI43_11250 [Mucilaginibacter sp.]|jgi:hypothetical protein